jgi:predicted CXXCH cytochrome family protein
MIVSSSPELRGKRLWLLGLATLVLVAAGSFAVFRGSLGRTPSPSHPPPIIEAKPTTAAPSEPMQLARGRNLTVWWDMLPDEVREQSVASGDGSNVRPADYVGPQTCQQCHAENYELWSKHPHRWMNALADSSTVKGDFSKEAAISYRGGRASFSREGSNFVMRLERGDLRRSYRITQTIGSRLFQYYVGRQTEGPEPKTHHFYSADHVLPFGYWLDQKEWVPIVHIGPEVADSERPDPFTPPERGQYYAEYATSCNSCHTTFPLADMFGRRTQQMGEHAPLPLHWSMRGYLSEAHPEMLNPHTGMVKQGKDGANPMHGWEASRYAATLGVSCEACHLGGREHVKSEGRVPPRFFPASPYLRVESKEESPPSGRSHDNLNWACGRCHTGPRPRFAAGMSTWNSVEYADAMRGSCYSQLRCVDCHNPHRGIGPRWSGTADREDAVCLKCHQQFQAAEKRVQHTHHPMGSEGARCLNCHMPRINEGIHDVVRTHMIYSPTRADMIESNHPNACNLCHTDKPIDWTLRSLKEWYGKTYKEGQIADNYPKRDKPVGLGWLDSKHESVRLVAVEAMTRAGDRPALPRLLDALDDPYLVNRQFAYKGLHEMLNVRLADFGYRFYMTKDERRKPLGDLRSRFGSDAPARKP